MAHKGTWTYDITYERFSVIIYWIGLSYYLHIANKTFVHWYQLWHNILHTEIEYVKVRMRFESYIRKQYFLWIITFQPDFFFYFLFQNSGT